MNERLFWWVSLILFAVYLTGIPVTTGFLLASVGGDVLIAMMGGFLWPLVLLGRAGWMLAS